MENSQEITKPLLFPNNFNNQQKGIRRGSSPRLLQI